MDASVAIEIEKFAKGKGLTDSARLKAIAWVESAGVFFWNVNGVQKPALRFEGHYFYRILRDEKPEKLATAVKAGLAGKSAGAVKNPNGWAARYALFERARAIDEDAAIRSCSWGIGQVMGDNWSDLGYASPKALMQDAYAGVYGQLEVMWRFIVANNLLNALKNGQWATFAARYNGPAYKKNRYDVKMAEAYAEFAANPHNGHLYLIQEKLKALGLYSGKIDGIYGPRTSGAIKNFQMAAGLAVDDDPGSVTIEQLDSYIASKKQKATKTKTVPTLVATGVAGAGAVGQITQAVETAQDAADQSKTLLETLNFSPMIITIVVAVVVAGVVFYLLRNASKDDEIENLSGVRAV